MAKIRLGNASDTSTNELVGVETLSTSSGDTAASKAYVDANAGGVVQFYSVADRSGRNSLTGLNNGDIVYERDVKLFYEYDGTNFNRQNFNRTIVQEGISNGTTVRLNVGDVFVDGTLSQNNLTYYLVTSALNAYEIGTPVPSSWINLDISAGEMIDINTSNEISVDLSEATTITQLTDPATTTNSYVVLDENGSNAKISIDNFNSLLPNSPHNDFHVVANNLEFVQLRNIDVGDWVYQTDSTILQQVTAVDGTNNNSITSTQSLYNTRVKFLDTTSQRVVIGDVVDRSGVLYLATDDPAPHRTWRASDIPPGYWIQISGQTSGNTPRIRVTSGAQNPASGERGDIFFNYASNIIYEWGANGQWNEYQLSDVNLPANADFNNLTVDTATFNGTVNFDGQANFVIGHPFVNAHTISEINSTQGNNDAAALGDLKRVRDQLEAEIGHGYSMLEAVATEKDTEALYTMSFELDGNTTDLFPHARRIPQTTIPPTPVNSGGNANNFLPMWASSWDEAPRYGDHHITNSQGFSSHSAGTYNPHSLTNFYGQAASGPIPYTVDGTNWNYDYQFVDYNFASGTRYAINNPNISLEFNQDVSPMATAVLTGNNGTTIDRVFTQQIVALTATPTTREIPVGSLVRWFQRPDNSGTDDRFYEIFTALPVGTTNSLHVPSDAVQRFPALHFNDNQFTDVGAPGISGVVKWQVNDEVDVIPTQYIVTCDTGDATHNWGVRTRHVAGTNLTDYRLQPKITNTGTSDREYFGFFENGNVLDMKFSGQISIPQGLTLRIRGEFISDTGTRTRRTFQFSTNGARGRFDSGFNETVIQIPIANVFQVIGGVVQPNHYAATGGEAYFVPTDGQPYALQEVPISHYELELVSRNYVQVFNSGGSIYNLSADATYRLGYHFWIDTSQGSNTPLQSVYIELYVWNTTNSTWDRVVPDGTTNRIDATVGNTRWHDITLSGQASTGITNYLEPTINLGIAEANQVSRQAWINHFAFGDMVIARPKGHWDATTIGTNLQALTGDTDVFYDLLAPATTGGIELSLRPSVEFQTDQYLKTDNTLRIDYNRNWIAPHTSSADTVAFQGQNFQISREDLPGGTNYMGPSELVEGDWFPASWPTAASGEYALLSSGGTRITDVLPAANNQFSTATDPFIVIHDTGSGYVDNISNHIPQGSLSSFQLFWDGTSADHVAEYTDDNVLSLRTTDTSVQKVTAYAVPAGSISNVSYDLGDAETTDPDTRKIYIPQMRTDWRTNFPIVEVVEGDAYSTITREGSSTLNGPGSAVLTNGSTVVLSDISTVVSTSTGNVVIHTEAAQGHNAYTPPASTSVGDTVVILQGDNATIGRRFIVGRVTGNRSVGNSLCTIPISYEQVDTLFDLNDTWEIYIFTGNVDPSETARVSYTGNDLFGRTHWIEGFFLQGRGESRFYTFGAYNTDNGLFDHLLYVDPTTSGGSTADIPMNDRELKTDENNGFNLEIVEHSRRNSGSLPAYGGNAGKVLVVDSGETAAEWSDKIQETSGGATITGALSVTAGLSVHSGTPANSYELPNNQGNANDVMTSDGEGGVAWVAPSGGGGPSYLPSTRGTAAANQILKSSSTSPFDFQIITDPLDAANLAVGASAVAGSNSVSVGPNSTTANISSSVAVGNTASCSGTAINAVAVGEQASATNIDAIAIGGEAVTSGANGFSAGYQANAGGGSSIAIGLQATAGSTGAGNMAFGSLSDANNGGLAIGIHAQATTTNSICICTGKDSNPPTPAAYDWVIDTTPRAVGGTDSTTNGGKLQWDDSAQNFLMSSALSTDDADLHVEGNIVAYSTTASDERLKFDVKEIDSALDKVDQIRGVTFHRVQDGKQSAGVIAQDIEKVLPQAVEEMELPLIKDDGEEYKTVNYDALHGLLIEAIKELRAEVKDLRSQLEDK